MDLAPAVNAVLRVVSAALLQNDPAEVSPGPWATGRLIGFVPLFVCLLACLFVCLFVWLVVLFAVSCHFCREHSLRKPGQSLSASLVKAEDRYGQQCGSMNMFACLRGCCLVGRVGVWVVGWLVGLLAVLLGG